MKFLEGFSQSTMKMYIFFFLFKSKMKESLEKMLIIIMIRRVLHGLLHAFSNFTTVKSLWVIILSFKN